MLVLFLAALTLPNPTLHTVILPLYILLALLELLTTLPDCLAPLQPLREQTEQIDECAGKVEEGVIGKTTLCDLAGTFADQFFEFLGVLSGEGEEFANEEEMEEFFLDFGVHEYLVGHVGDQRSQVDTLLEPLLTEHAVDFGQRHHVLAFEALPRAHTRLVLSLHAALPQVLDQRNEDVLGVVLLEGQVSVAEAPLARHCPLLS